MALKRKNYVLIFDYYADPELNHETVEDDVAKFLHARIRGQATKLGNCVVVKNCHDALTLKLHFFDHVVEVSHQ